MYRLATLPQRAIAFFLDTLIALGGITVVNFLLFLYAPFEISNAVGQASLVVMVAYFFLRDAKHGQSIGKKIVKLRVIQHSTGMPANPLHSILRNIPLALLWWLEPFVVLQKSKRRLGDLLGSTSVVRLAK